MVNDARPTILITGGCGFIGHHFVEHIIRKTNWNIVIIDKLTYASAGYSRLRSNGAYTDPRVKLFSWDLTLPIPSGLSYEIGSNITYIVHMAAETHVDNSIKSPVSVIQNNINSTIQILEFARNIKGLKQFFYFSTDEVYGPALNDKLFSENERHAPTNPYSASKSGGEQICNAYKNTYNVPVISVNVMNAFGERQHVEKFIPKVIYNILHNKTIYVHSYPNKTISGSRFYIHARNIASAVLFLIENGSIGECYNISGEQEVTNLDIVTMVSKILKLPAKIEMTDFHSDRPGHDLRYGLDGEKLKKLGWVPPLDFDASFENCVRWFVNNQEWLEE
jgi:dTDP-glucose 4,6-dehydratase